MDMAQTPPQGQMAEAPAQGGMTICINVAPGGSITVSKEAYEAAEGTGQPAQGIGDALKQALELYQQSSAAEGEAAFDQGFGAKPQQPAKPAPTGMQGAL